METITPYLGDDHTHCDPLFAEAANHSWPSILPRTALMGTTP